MGESTNAGNIRATETKALDRSASFQEEGKLYIHLGRQYVDVQTLNATMRNRLIAYFANVKEIDEHILGGYMLGLKQQSPEEIGGVVFAET